jgi:hypothetical protein
MAIVIEPANRRGDGAKHVLDDIGGIGVLQAPLASETIDDRAIKIDEILPRGVIGAVADFY